MQAGAQGLQQLAQAVVVYLVHQRQQPAQIAFGKAFTRKPVEVVAGQVGNGAALVFAKGHGGGEQAQQLLGVKRCGHAESIARLQRPLTAASRYKDQFLYN